MFSFVILLTAVVGVLGAVIPPGLQTDLEGRIVQGHPTSISSFPYQISLQIGGFHFCGGSIISEQIIVTAAHCLDPKMNPKHLRVRAGSSQWTVGGVLVGVKAFKSHKHYNAILQMNDIAVIRLNTSLVFSSVIKPIKLPTVSPTSGKVGVVSGWGITKFGSDSIPTQLKHVELKILTRKECSSSVYNYNRLLIKKGMICTYHNGKDSCQGDSGGPLVSGNELVGVVSWGFGCASENYPGVYTDVALQHDWIRKAVADLESEP